SGQDRVAKTVGRRRIDLQARASLGANRCFVPVEIGDGSLEPELRLAEQARLVRAMETQADGLIAVADLVKQGTERGLHDPFRIGGMRGATVRKTGRNVFAETSSLAGVAKR